jgi:hypothetical protein
MNNKARDAWKRDWDASARLAKPGVTPSGLGNFTGFVYRGADAPGYSMPPHSGLKKGVVLTVAPSGEKERADAPGYSMLPHSGLKTCDVLTGAPSGEI